MEPSNFSAQMAPLVEEDTHCELIGGSFSIMVQMLLGLFAATSLYVKWRLETPRRTFQTWLFDMSKQGTSGLVAHGLNMFFAKFLSHSQETEGDECAWYFVNFVFDTVLGVPFCWFLLRVLERLARTNNWTSLRTSGDYGDPPVIRRWALQLSAWVGIIAITKTTLAIPLYLQSGPVSLLGEWLFKPIQPYPKTELVVVMILSPGLLNVVQFWILDQILKKDGGCKALVPRCCSFNGTEQVPLLSAGKDGISDKKVIARGTITNQGYEVIISDDEGNSGDSILVQRSVSGSAVEPVVARV